MRTAAYARYSSENQREASIDDQLRDARALCSRTGLSAPRVYSDSEISGERRDRPGYVALMRDAQVGRIDTLVLWDLKRLSRGADLPQVLERLKFWRVRVVTCDGFDSAQEGSDIRGWVDGMMGNRYLRDLAKATHRGLTGRALSGASAGGLPYGYRRGAAAGDRVVDQAQAEVVRRIFREYAAGATPRAIAAGLNRDGVPPARGPSWAMTAIHGDVRRGIGILVNPIYVGRPIWNRSRFVKHPDTGRRVRVERPEAEWIRQDVPALAIVDEALWQRVQARLRGASRDTGTGGAGRPPRHLLSGLLRCGDCGGPLVVVDRYSYACSVAKDRGTCASRVRLPRKDAEHALLGGIREQLLTEAAFERFRREAAAALKKAAPNLDGAKRRLDAAARERDNVMAAIRAGIITPTTRAEMLKAEAAVTEAQGAIAALKAYQPTQFLPRARETWSRIVDALADTARNVPAARDAIRQLLGDRIVVRNENGDLVAEIAAASDAQINVVAGACSVLYLHEPLRIPLSRAS